jgi:hypothetical protein
MMVNGNPVLVDHGFLHVPAAAFKPAGIHNGAGGDNFFFFGGFVQAAFSCTIAFAPVHLPHGVTVDSVFLTAVDRSPSSLDLYLERRFSFNAELGGTPMSLIQTDADSLGLGLWIDDTITDPEIDNGLYLYYLTAEVCPTRKIRSVFIYYSHPTQEGERKSEEPIGLEPLARGQGIDLRPPAVSTSPVACDSRRIGVEEMMQLLPGGASNPKADPAVTVEGDPVLTDRGFVHIPAPGFTPMTTDTYTLPHFYGDFHSAGGWVDGDSSFCAPFVAAIQLPEGVTVDSVFLLAVDDSTGILDLLLERRFAFDTAVNGTPMAWIQTDNNNPGLALWIDDTISDPVVANGLYQYYLTGCVYDDRKIRSVFIYYSY